MLHRICLALIGVIVLVTDRSTGIRSDNLSK